MKYTKENLLPGTPEYQNACASLDMYLRKRFGGGPYNKGATSESKSMWFDVPYLEGWTRGGWTWASLFHEGESFGIILCYHREEGTKITDKTFLVKAAIPSNKLQWNVKEI